MPPTTTSVDGAGGIPNWCQWAALVSRGMNGEGKSWRVANGQKPVDRENAVRRLSTSMVRHPQHLRQLSQHYEHDGKRIARIDPSTGQPITQQLVSVDRHCANGAGGGRHGSTGLMVLGRKAQQVVRRGGHGGLHDRRESFKTKTSPQFRTFPCQREKLKARLRVRAGFTTD